MKIDELIRGLSSIRNVRFVQEVIEFYLKHHSDISYEKLLEIFEPLYDFYFKEIKKFYELH